MFNPWLALILQTAPLGLEAQNVIALRLMRLAGGGASGADEARLMVTDKMAALSEAHFAAATGVLAGRDQDRGLPTEEEVVGVLRVQRHGLDPFQLARRVRAAAGRRQGQEHAEDDRCLHFPSRFRL